MTDFIILVIVGVLFALSVRKLITDAENGKVCPLCDGQCSHCASSCASADGIDPSLYERVRLK